MNFPSELALWQRKEDRYLGLDEAEQLNKKTTKNHSLVEQKIEQVKEEVLSNHLVLQHSQLSLIALPESCIMQVFNYSEIDLFTIKLTSKTFKKIVEENMPILWMEEIKKDPLFILFIPINHSLKVNQQWKIACKNIMKETRLTLNLRNHYPNFFNRHTIDEEKKPILTSHVLKKLIKWCEAAKTTIDFYGLKRKFKLINLKKVNGYSGKLEKDFKTTEQCLESEIKVAKAIKEWLAQHPDLEIKSPLSKKSESDLKQEFSELDRDFFENILNQDNMSGNIDLFGNNPRDLN